MALQPNHAQLERELGQLQGEMKAVNESLKRIEEALGEALEKMEQRVRLLEDKESQRKGALALAMLVCGFIGALLTKLIHLGGG